MNVRDQLYNSYIPRYRVCSETNQNVAMVPMDLFNFVSGKLTAGGIAGGSVMLVALILGIVLSILWNKGMLPHTRYVLLVVLLAIMHLLFKQILFLPHHHIEEELLHFYFTE